MAWLMTMNGGPSSRAASPPNRSVASRMVLSATYLMVQGGQVGGMRLFQPRSCWPTFSTCTLPLGWLVCKVVG